MPILQFRNDTRITHNPSYETTILKGLQDSIAMFETLMAEAKAQADKDFCQRRLVEVKARIAELRWMAVWRKTA